MTTDSVFIFLKKKPDFNTILACFGDKMYRYGGGGGGGGGRRIYVSEIGGRNFINTVNLGSLFRKKNDIPLQKVLSFNEANYERSELTQHVSSEICAKRWKTKCLTYGCTSSVIAINGYIRFVLFLKVW